ncbi:MAG: alginate export family protein [Phycisphaerae bacterium]|nr:alginate export family protein [Phycisphaerae bacterium]
MRRMISIRALVTAAVLAAAVGDSIAAKTQTTANEALSAEQGKADDLSHKADDGSRDDATQLDKNLVDKIKQPTSWFTWGMDLRLREVYIGNGFTLDKKNPDHEWHWQRMRARWWATIAPTKDLDFNLRIAWEGKHFDRPLARENWQPTSVVLDRLNFKWKNVAGLPLTIQPGRQELMLGDRWLVMDGTPLDGSSTVYFDAVRITVDLEDIDTSLDLIYLEQDAEGEHWICPIHDEHRHLIEHDETGVILWFTNKSLPHTQLDWYFIYKKDTPALPNGNLGELYTFGVRAEHRFSERLKLRGNLAAQFGRRNDASVCALGALARLSYSLRDDWRSSLRLDYEYLSGDKPGTGTDESFDILWGRWPRFSELYLYTYGGETRVGGATNLHRVTVGWTGHPTGKMELRADYHLLFADQNTYGDLPGFSKSGCFRGQLVAGVMKYKFTEHLSGHLLAEFFFPGDYYSDERNDPAAFLRAQLQFTW